MFDKTTRELVYMDLKSITASIRWGNPVYFYWLPLPDEPDGYVDVDLPSITGLFLHTALQQDRHGTVKVLREALKLSRENDWRVFPDWMHNEMITRFDLLIAIDMVVKEFKINELYWEVEGWPIPKRGWSSPGMSDHFTPQPKQGELFE